MVDCILYQLYNYFLRLVLRICSGNLDNYHSIKAEGATHKFGCSIEEAKALLEKAKSLDMNIVGIRYRIVLQATTLWDVLPAQFPHV